MVFLQLVKRSKGLEVQLFLVGIACQVGSSASAFAVVAVETCPEPFVLVRLAAPASYRAGLVIDLVDLVAAAAEAPAAFQVVVVASAFLEPEHALAFEQSSFERPEGSDSIAVAFVAVVLLLQVAVLDFGLASVAFASAIVAASAFAAAVVRS